MQTVGLHPPQAHFTTATAAPRSPRPGHRPPPHLTPSLELVESRMRGDAHVRFGGRAEETDRGTTSVPRLGPTQHVCAHEVVMAYVCFIVDAFSRRIVGWRVAAHIRTETCAPRWCSTRWKWPERHEVAAGWSAWWPIRMPLTPSSSRLYGSPNVSTRSAHVPASARSPISFDTALAETTNGLYKAECVCGPDSGHARLAGRVPRADARRLPRRPDG